jgi:fucose 4-O-acetylase-like acetyltransferase
LLLTQDIKKIKLDYPKNILKKAGDNSLFVYIWHMPFAGIVANLFSYRPLIMLVLIRPFIVLAILLLAEHVLRCVFKRSKIQKLGTAIGIKG